MLATKTETPSNTILWVRNVARISGLHYIPSRDQCLEFIRWYNRAQIESQVPRAQKEEVFREYWLLKGQACQDLAAEHFRTRRAQPMPVLRCVSSLKKQRTL